METSSTRLLACRTFLALCLGLGLANAAGWVLDIPVLVSLFERFPKMVPSTTALVLSSAAGFWLLLDAPASCRAAGMLGALVCAVGMFMLACYLVGTAPRPFLLARPGIQTGVTLSSPLTAGLLALLGMALLLLARGRHVKLAQLSAMVVLLVSLLNLAGYFSRTRGCMRCFPAKACRSPRPCRRSRLPA